jgi:hypothetical protein
VLSLPSPGKLSSSLEWRKRRTLSVKQEEGSSFCSLPESGRLVTGSCEQLLGWWHWTPSRRMVSLCLSSHSLSKRWSVSNRTGVFWLGQPDLYNQILDTNYSTYKHPPKQLKRHSCILDCLFLQKKELFWLHFSHVCDHKKRGWKQLNRGNIVTKKSEKKGKVFPIFNPNWELRRLNKNVMWTEMRGIEEGRFTHTFKIRLTGRRGQVEHYKRGKYKEC